VASPDPEANENKKDTTTSQDPAEKDVTESARITVVVSHSKGINTEVRAPNNQTPAKEKRYRNWQTIWQGLTALFTGLAFLAVTYYACQAKKQVAEAITANHYTLEIFHRSQRAYVGLGDHNGVLGEIAEENGIPEFFLNLRNSGHGPALNLKILVKGRDGVKLRIHASRYRHSETGRIDLCNQGIVLPAEKGNGLYGPFASRPNPK
jgi:hypothetical protein